MGPLQRLALIPSATIILLLLAGCGGSSATRSAGSVEHERGEPDLRGQRGPRVPGAGRRQPDDRQSHQSRLATRAADGRVSATAGVGWQQRDRHLCPGTADPSADRNRLSRHGGAGNRAAVRHAEPDHPAAAGPCSGYGQQLSGVLVVYSRIHTAGRCAPVAALSGLSGSGLQDQQGDNEALLNTVIEANAPGYYVFSAPWETVSTLLANINRLKDYNLITPASLRGTEFVYALTINPAGTPRLITYNANLSPPDSYPTLPAGGIVAAACTQTFSIQVTGGVDTAVVPAGTNTNETVYMIRHAEAHPLPYFEDGNYVGAGQWRALDLPNALQGKIKPDVIYSIDPAIGDSETLGGAPSSYIRPR